MNTQHVASSWTAVVALLLGVVLFPAAATAQSIYLSGAAGHAAQASDSRPYGMNIAIDPDFPGAFASGDGAVGAFAVGYTLGASVRLEGRVGLQRGSFAETQFGTGARAGEKYILDGQIESTTFTFEAFYDFRLVPFTPYLKAGVGVSRNSYSARLGGAGVAAFDPFDGTPDGYYDAYSDETTNGFTWNAGIGASRPLSSRIDLFGEYQFTALGDAETGQDDFTDGFRIDGANTHTGFVGIRIRLGS